MTKTAFLGRIAFYLVVTAVLFCIPPLVVNYVVYGTLSLSLTALGLSGLVCRVLQVEMLVFCAHTAFRLEYRSSSDE